MKTTKPPKDANDVLKARGPEALEAVLAAAEPFELPDDEESGDRGGKAKAGGPVRVGELLGPAVERLEARAYGLELPVPVPWPSVAVALGGGLWPGMHTLTSTTGAGKTQLCLQIALYAALAGTPVVYVGLELDREQLVARLLALLSRLNREGRPGDQLKWSKLFLGQAGRDVPRSLAARFGDELRGLPFWLELAPPHGWPYTRLEACAREVRQAHAVDGDKPMLVVLDFLQLVASPSGREREDLRERVSRAAYVGRAVSIAHNAAVLLVSSAARNNYDDLSSYTGARSPAEFVGLGKESGDIEYAADTVLALVGEKLAEGAPVPVAEHRRVQLAVAKGRAVVPSWTPLMWDGNAFREPSPLEASESAVKEEPREHRVSVPRETKGRGRRAKT